MLLILLNNITMENLPVIEEVSFVGQLDNLFQEVLDENQACCTDWIFSIVKVPVLFFSIGYLTYQKSNCLQVLGDQWTFSFYHVAIIIVVLLGLSILSSLLYIKNYRRSMNRILYYCLFLLSIFVSLAIVVVVPSLSKLYPQCQQFYPNFGVIVLVIIEYFTIIMQIIIITSYALKLHTLIKTLNMPIYEVLNVPVEISEISTQDQITEEMVNNCPICLDKYEIGHKIIKLKCNHCYHDYCIMGWFNVIKNKSDITCPYCCQSVKIEEV